MNRTLRYSLILFSSITVINILISLIFGSISFAFAGASILVIILSGLTSAAIITLLIIQTTPVMRNYLSTYRQLLRLDTLSHPLLLKLQQAAPSTFQHSLQVANLGHRAAKAIGADAFLTRIGGYYHDIGKIKNANHFIENKPHGQQDTNSKLTVETIKIIQDHVLEGVKLAKENNLPEEVISFIPEHHGTNISLGLYNKAKEENLKINKKDFRYPGPKPLSKETGIIMLADAIESKLRTLPEFSPQAMTEVIDSIISERQADKQLELSGLTSQDLKSIRKAFIEGVQIIYHQRIKYPENETTQK